ncbi:MAG: lipopolysaccharide biosynthesis protein, partial [Methylocystis sp.]
LWFIKPSIEALFVPAQCRGPFGHYLGLLLPGLFAMGVILFGVNPVFQIEKKTTPLIVAALAAVAFGLVLLFALPWGEDASNLAIAQGGAYVAALAATVYFALRTQPVWPSFWDMIAALVATGAMSLAVTPLREMTPGVLTLIEQILAGAVVYGLLTVAFNIAGLGDLAAAWFGRRLARP